MDDGYILWTDIACSPHKPYIIVTLYCLFTEVRGQVKCEDNGERILYVDGQERSIVKLVSWANVEVLQLKTEQMGVICLIVKCKPSANYACAVPLIDGLGY